jgi:hypothetical protein
MAVKIGPSFNDCVTNFSGNAGNKCHNTWRKKCPPQEQAFLLTFLALKKVRRLAGRDPPVLFLILVLLLISMRLRLRHTGRVRLGAGGWRLEAGG